MNLEYLALSVAGGTSAYLIKDLITYVNALKQTKIDNIKIDESTLKIGYVKDGRYCYPITVSMRYNPHLLVCGLSQQGKSKMVEYAMQNKQVMLINCYDDDYKTLDSLARVNGVEDIDKVLRYLCDKMDGNRQPLYIVIDEALSLSLCGKDISKSIMRLLSQGAHNCIYVICITQSADKEILKYKQLFNSRVCFKMVDDTQYKSCLGCMPFDDCLMYRQFYYVAGADCGVGNTYDI